MGFNIAGKTLGVVGLGNIGRELFRLARGVGFRRLLAYVPGAPNAEEIAAGVEYTRPRHLDARKRFRFHPLPLEREDPRDDRRAATGADEAHGLPD